MQCIQNVDFAIKVVQEWFTLNSVTPENEESESAVKETKPNKSTAWDN